MTPPPLPTALLLSTPFAFTACGDGDRSSGAGIRPATPRTEKQRSALQLKISREVHLQKKKPKKNPKDAVCVGFLVENVETWSGPALGLSCV